MFQGAEGGGGGGGGGWGGGGGGGGAEGDRKWVGMLYIPFSGQNQRSCTFNGLSNLSGLPGT